MFKLPTTIIFVLLTMHSFGQKTGTVDYLYLGVKFTIPQGWQGQETEGAFMIASYNHAGFIALIPHESKSIGELEREAKKGVAEDNIYLNLSSALSKFGAEGIGGEFSGTIEGTPAKAYILGVVNPFGYGVTVVAATDVSNYSSKYKQWAEQVASSLQFRTPKEPEKSKEWKDWFNGAKLVYMNSNYSSGSSYGGYSTYSSYDTRREILLCSNGQFSYYSSSSMSVDTGGGFAGSHGKDQGQGNWKIGWDAAGNSTLELSYNNGKKSTYTLAYQNKKTTLNGTRYFVLHDHNECR
ncbi:MAG: hypothetical protein AAFX87_29260 [Bacteroidota bacterium]